jgi:hypothetical protein
MSSDADEVLAELLALVESAGDNDDETVHRIEAARDQVRPEHVTALVEAYGRLTDWPRRRAVIEMIQDRLLPVALPVMRHFLAGAPADGTYDHALAAAAAQVDGDLSHFERYYDVPGALDAARRAARDRGG